MATKPTHQDKTRNQYIKNLLNYRNILNEENIRRQKQVAKIDKNLIAMQPPEVHTAIKQGIVALTFVPYKETNQ